MKIKVLFRALAPVLVLLSAGAQANLLTNGDFETNNFNNLLAVPGQWGGEFNSSLTGAEYGVSPFGNQMLKIGDAGGGSAAQVAQQVTGTFTTGSTVTFDVQFNAKTSGALAYTRLWLGAWGGPSIQTSLWLDGSASTWETLYLSTVLTSDVTSIFAEIWTPIVSGGGVGWYVEYPVQYLYADNAVLTVTPPAPVPAPSLISLLMLGLFALRAPGRARLGVANSRS